MLRPIAITKLQPEERLLFACLKQELNETVASELAVSFQNQPIAWEAIFSIAFVQGVAPLIYVNLKKCSENGLSIPTETMKNFELSHLAAKELNTYRNEKLKEILLFISNTGEDVMLLKGAAYNVSVFQNPALTVSGDIDLLVKCGSDHFSEKQLQYIYGFNRKESFEISFQDHHDLDLNQMISLDYEKIWQDAQSVELFNSTYFIMGPEDLLIFACVNSGRKRFFHLRSLYNISEIIKTYPAMDWDIIAGKVRTYNCENIVFAALLTAYCTVGSPVPKNLDVLFHISFLRLKLIRYLVQNMSFSDLADRTLFLNGGTAVTKLTDKNKWNRSGLLLLGVYSARQFMRRLKVLFWQQRK